MEKEFQGRSKSMKEFDRALDKAAGMAEPLRAKNPEEMKENPDLYLDEGSEDVQSRQKALDDTWDVATPGRAWGIDDNGSGRKSSLEPSESSEDHK